MSISRFYRNSSHILISIIIVVLIISMIFIFKNNNLKNNSRRKILSSTEWRGSINVYIVGTAGTTVKAEKLLRGLRVNVRAAERLEKSGVEWADVVLVDSGWLRSSGVKYKSILVGALRAGKPVASYGFNAANRLIGAVGKNFFLEELTLTVGGEPLDGKTPNLELPVKARLFAVVARRGEGRLLVPDYLVIVRDEGDLRRDLVDLLNWLVELGVVGGSREVHSITEINGFRYVGSIGWKYYYIRYCGNSVGDLQVRSKYYYYGGYVGGVFYKWFLIYVNHLTTGYGDAAWCGSCLYANWALHESVTRIDGHTDLFPGQVFDDMGPKNARTCVSGISYEVSAGVNGPPPSGTVGASVSVSYNPNQISYTSSVNTATGVVRWTHSPCQHAADTTWWVEPSAIFYLDPTKDFGYEPLAVTHYYYSEVKGYTTPQCGGVDYASGQASYTAYVKSTGVGQG